MKRVFSIVLLVGLGLPLGAVAQSNEGSSEQTLADIRQELSVLYVEVQRLNRELSTTGGATGTSGAGSVLDRVVAIEGELQRLTAKTEALDFRIQNIVRDGTNRIGDLEFRLCELEANCDVGQLSDGSTLGGEAGADNGGGVAVGQVVEQPDVQMAVGEKADFNAAQEALTAGNWAEAAQILETFRQSYPGSPLGDQASVMLGDAREGAGDLTGAARAYLDVFSASPDGSQAPAALYKLGRTLGRLGQTSEACVTLGEVELRFPNAETVSEAQAEMRNLGCS